MILRRRSARTIQSFSPEVWDSLAIGRRAMRHRWHQVAEEAFRDHRPLYALFEDGDGPFALLVADENDADDPVPGQLSKLALMLGRRTLVVCAPSPGEPLGLVFRRGVTFREGLLRLAPHLRTLCAEEGKWFLAVLGVGESDLPDFAARGYQKSSIPAANLLELAPSYDEHLQRLKRDHRKKLGRVGRRAAERGVTFETHERFAHRSEELYALFCAQWSRHGYGHGRVPYLPNLFEVLERTIPDDTVLFEARVEGELAGFTLAIREGDTLAIQYSGYAYHLSQPNFVYTLLADHAIRWAIGRGLKRVNRGTMMYAEKRRLGFVAPPLWCCYRASSPIVNSLIGHIVPLVDRLVFDRGGSPSGDHRSEPRSEPPSQGDE